MTMTTRTDCPFTLDAAEDPTNPADTLHRAAACYVHKFGDVDGLGGTRRLTEGQINELLWQVAWMRKLVDRMELAAVDVARDHGATWQATGAALGISKQAAQQRFGAKAAS